MRLLRELFRILMRIVYSVFLLIITVVLIVGFVALTTNINSDTGLIMSELKTNKSLCDFVSGFQNVMSVMVASCIVVIVRFKGGRKLYDLDLMINIKKCDIKSDLKKDKINSTCDNRDMHLRI